MIKNIYIAGPLFNAHERSYLELIAAQLEGSGYTCFLPHRDQSGIDDSELEGTNLSQGTKDKIFNTDLTALKAADLTVALITGQDIDSGTAAEIGFTYAKDRPIIAITAYERRFRNLFVDGMISKTVDDVADLLPAIASLNPQG
ncbi:MAG: nucleoside 2-deoxyribosyltransferase [Planktomarina sp.]|jgi:nucleoside 2-deoxyribosyltransferase|nr:nucleoside 2-deoxyribosyltransferase [Planktomarina sp.]